MIDRSDLEERVETTRAWYIGCHGAYWNAMRFGPGPVVRAIGSWPLPHVPSYSNEEKETKRLEMERCKSLWDDAVSELQAFDELTHNAYMTSTGQPQQALSA
jgi:hypothetical protein